MALPEGITPKTVTVGIPTKFNGTPATGSATLTAPKNLVHVPTGVPLFSGSVTKQFKGLTEVTFTDLVPTDADGLNRVDWTYTLTVRVNGAVEQPEPIVFVIPEAGPDVIDAELLVEVPSSAGTPVSALVLTAETALATIEEAATVAPTGAWDFATAPTVDGSPISGAPADGSITPTKLSFDPATQTELNAAVTAINTEVAARIGAIVLTPTGVAATDGPAMNAAVTTALADGRSIYMKPGMYRRTTAWDCRGSGLRIITDGVHAVTIEQVTNNIPVILVGKDFQDIGGMFLQYGSEQPDTATGANAVEIYKGYLSHYRGFYIYGAARGLYLPQVNYDLGNGDATGNYIFSCRVDDIRVLQWSHTAIDLQSYLATSTGSIFANIYMNNEAHGAATSAKRGANFLSFDELTIMQLNVEGTTISDDSPVLFNQIRAGKIIGMHFERVKNTQWGAGFLNVNNDTKLSVDGLSVVYCPFANAAGGQADLLGIIKIGDACQVVVNTLNMHSNTSLTAADRPLVVGWGITSPVTSVEVVGSTDSSVTTAIEAINTPIGGTAPAQPVVKRRNLDRAAVGQSALPLASTWITSPHVTRSATGQFLNIQNHTPIWLTKTVSVTAIACEVTTAGAAGAVIRLGIYGNNGGKPGTLIVDAGTVATTSTGVKSIAITQTLQPGLYWLASVVQVATCSTRSLATCAYSLSTAAAGGANNANNMYVSNSGVLAATAPALTTQADIPTAVFLQVAA